MAHRRALPLTLSFAALTLAGCVRGLGTAEEPFVASLELRGVTAFDTSEIEEVIATQDPVRRSGIAGVLVKDRQPLDPEALATDRRRVEAFYRERGYYGAKVEEVRVEPAGRGLVKVTIVVREGTPVRVSKLTVTGLESAPEAASRVETHLRVGDVFTESAYDATKEAIVQALLATGWATGEVKASALVLPETDSAEVTYEVRPGPRYRFGAIFVAGSASVSRSQIRAQAAAAVKTGDWWDESKLAQAQARVFELGAFGGVRVARGEPDAARGSIPVVVAIREAPFRTVRFGPGVALEATQWEAHGLVGWRHRNFLGDLRHLRFDARAGYAWLLTTPRKEGPAALLATDFQQPAAISTLVDATARLELERGLEAAYDFYAERLRLGLPIRLSPRWRIVPSYNLEVFQLSNTATDFAPGSGTTGPVLENCRGSVCLLSYLEQRIAWDGREPPGNTRRGFYVALAVQEGFAVGSFGYRYLRVLPEVQAFWSLGRSAVLATRARVGALAPISEEGEPPIVARFTAGGPASMRGYYTGRFSKMVLQEGEWVPVGGNGLADGTVELRFDVAGPLGAVVFVDAASIADSSSLPSAWQTALDPTRLQFAAGSGLRYKTPFGPLRLDVGVRLVNAQGEWFPPVPFTPEGTTHREPIVAVHLSLGEAF